MVAPLLPPLVPPLVLVTRPSAVGQRLCDQLTKRGHHAVWWPAFTIGPAPDAATLQAALSRLAHYDLAVFVSANAVRSAAQVLNGEWPVSAAIGAVGAATLAAIRSELQPDSRVTVIGPDADDESGSEPFWRAWDMSGRKAHRVLVLRAEEGREWLTERFVQAGAQVDAVAVYSRRPHRLSTDERTLMQSSLDTGIGPTVVFSSSEAIATLDAQVGESAQAWLRSGTAISTHPRISAQLRAAGYARVINTAVDDESIIATLESGAL